MDKTTFMWTEYLIQCLSLGEDCCSVVQVNTSQSSAPLTSSYDSHTSSEESLTDSAPLTDSTPLDDTAPLDNSALLDDTAPLIDSAPFDVSIPLADSSSKDPLPGSSCKEPLSVSVSRIPRLLVSSSKEPLSVSSSDNGSVSPLTFTSLTAMLPNIMTAGGDTMGLAPTNPPQDIYFFANSPTLLANLPPSPLFELLDDDMGCEMEDISLEHEFPPPGESIAILHNIEEKDKDEDENEVQDEDEDDPEYFPEDDVEIEVVSIFKRI
jgi:hypothetical protein